MSLDNTLLTLAIASVLNSPLDLATASVPLNKTYSQGLPNGTGAGQADKIFHDTRTVNASTNDDLDLAGVLVDGLGNTITFARIKAMIFSSAAANAQNFSIGGAAANQFVNWVGAATHTITMTPGGLFVLTAPGATGFAVTAGTGDLLRVANGAGVAITYDVILIGASA
jgi:hypothetical protein